MAKFKLLADLYRFPGFAPLAHLQGVFGEPGSVLLTLRRRRKKRCVVSAARRTAVTTTSDLGESAISPVATNASTSSSLSAGFNAHGVEA